MRYFIIAGERSGDMHAARLVAELRKADTSAEISAWGGDLMEEAGARLMQHYKDISFMGLWEVIKNLSTIRKKLRLCQKHMAEFKPDVVILVDFPGFNLRMAEHAKSLGIKTCYYISPKIWAWKKSRITKIRQFVDKMLVILPFEEDFYRTLNYPVTYVGNPLVEVIDEHSYDYAGLEVIRDSSLNKVAFLPGSRVQEVTKAVDVINEMAASLPDLLFMVAGVDNLSGELYEKIEERENVTIHYNKTYELLKLANVAVVTSGTATLEAAIIGTRQVVVYKTSWFTYLIGRMLVKIQFISLVNLIARKKVVDELIQSEYKASTVLRHIHLLTENSTEIRKMEEDYAEIREKMGKKKAAKNAASEIISMLR